MFFYLSKILAFIISPIVWIFVLLIWSFLTKVDKRAKRLRIIAIVIFYIFSNSFLVDECFRLYEPVTQDVDTMHTQYDAAIILGGIGEVDLRLNKINFSYSSDRLFQVLPLYYNGRVHRVIFTGGSGSIEFPEKKEGIYVGKYLHSIHFPDSALTIESESRNTYENAVFTKRIIDSLHIRGPLLLVTSAYHMPRSLAIFKKAGFQNITPYPTNRFSGQRRWTPDHLLIPNAGALISIQMLIHEWVGFLTYKMRGYA